MFVSEELAAYFRSSICPEDGDKRMAKNVNFYQATCCHISEDIDLHEIVFNNFWALKTGSGGTYIMTDHTAGEVALFLVCPWDRFNTRYTKVLQYMYLN
jgi:hypothetical protein